MYMYIIDVIFVSLLILYTCVCLSSIYLHVYSQKAMQWVAIFIRLDVLVLERSLRICIRIYDDMYIQLDIWGGPTIRMRRYRERCGSGSGFGEASGASKAGEGDDAHILCIIFTHVLYK